MKAPNFTSATAREMQARSTASRLARIAREKAAHTPAHAPNSDDARREVALRQLDQLDAMIDVALARRDEATFLRLAAAKAKLWSLVQPTMGQVKPFRPRPAQMREL